MLPYSKVQEPGSLDLSRYVIQDGLQSVVCAAHPTQRRHYPTIEGEDGFDLDQASQHIGGLADATAVRQVFQHFQRGGKAGALPDLPNYLHHFGQRLSFRGGAGCGKGYETL